MEAPAVSRLLLAIPATCILALLLEYIRRNRGVKTAVAYAMASAGYGLLRGAWVSSISASHNVPMPYRMAGSVRIGAVSPMEIAGWMLAGALAWLAGAAIVAISGRAVAATAAWTRKRRRVTRCSDMDLPPGKWEVYPDRVNAT